MLTLLNMFYIVQPLVPYLGRHPLPTTQSSGDDNDGDYDGVVNSGDAGAVVEMILMMVMMGILYLKVNLHRWRILQIIAIVVVIASFKNDCTLPTN